MFLRTPTIRVFLRTPTIREITRISSIYWLPCDETICGCPNLVPERVALMGPCLWEPDDYEATPLWEFLADTPRDRVVYLQAGRVFGGCGLVHAASLALGGTDYKIVVDAHRMDERQLTYPANFFAAGHVPVGHILPRAGLVLSTGMSLSYLAALSFGVPIFAVTSGGSGTGEITDRILKLGVGIVMPLENVSPENIRLGIDYLRKSEGIQTKAIEVAESIAKYKGFSRAASLLSRLEYMKYGKTDHPVGGELL